MSEEFIPKATYNPFFRKWGEFVVTYRWAVLAMIAAVTVASVYQIATKLYVDNSPEAFMDSGSEAAQVLETFRDIFGRDDVYLILVEGDVFSRPYLDKLAKLHAELASMNIEVESLGERKSERDAKRGRAVQGPATDPAATEPSPDTAGDADDEFGDLDADFGDDSGFGQDDEGWGEEAGGSVIDEVISLINVRKIRAQKVGDDVGIEVGDLLDPMPESDAALAAIRDEVLGNPQKGIPADRTIVGQVVSPDGRYSAIVVRTQFMSQPDGVRVFDRIQEILEPYRADNFKLYTAGMPPFEASLQRLMLGDMQMLVGLSLAVIGFFLLLMFVHPMGAVVPLMVVAASALWTLGLMATLHIPMTVLTNIIPAFLICVGVADSVHLISIYRQILLRGVNRHEAAVMAVAETGVPMLFTTLTTAVGLGSFVFASVDAIGEMGTMGAFGVFAALLNTLTLLPAMLSFNKHSLMGADKERRMSAVDGFLKLCTGLSGSSDRGRRGTLVLAAALAVIAGFGASKLYVWHDPLSWVPADKPISVAFHTTDDHLGGTASVQLLIEAKGPRGVKDLRLQQGIEKLGEYVRAFVHPKLGIKIVSGFRSVSDMLREINQALSGGDPKAYHLPDKQAVVDNYFVFIESSGPDDLKRVMTLDARTTQVTISLKWLEATSYLPFAEYVDKGVAEFIPKDLATVSTTGTVFNFLSTVGMLLLDLLKTFSIAFVVITVLMILLLRDLKLGLISMVPNLLPIACILGIMGYFDIPIDMANLMIASIALGIAVDDTIHLLHHYKVHYDLNGNVEAALQHALHHTGRALVVTSLILSVGFYVYLTSQIYSLQRFGSLIGTTILIAVVLDLTLTPALVRTFFKDRPASPQT